MSENEVTRILKKENISISVSTYTKPNIAKYFIAKDFTSFINEQISKWEIENKKNNQWNQVLIEFESLKNAWDAILNLDKMDDTSIRTKIEQIRTKTFEKPLFVYNAKAVDYINTIKNQVADWSNLIINQFIQPDSINILRQDFRLAVYFFNILSIVKSESNEISETIQLNNRTIERLEDVKVKMNEWQNEHENERKEYSNKIDAMINEQNSAEDIFRNEHDEKLKQIEKTYEERVRIAKPSELWNAKMIQYSNRGRLWTIVSFIIAVIISIMCITFFKIFPNIFTNSSEKAFDITGSIKWLILTGIGIGTFIYLLRLSVKLALSSFHMSRDAEERCALTSFYLSLINDKKLDPETERELKNIVMNALFARVDTGLLKGDTSPTIPTAGFSEILRLISGK